MASEKVLQAKQAFVADLTAKLNEATTGVIVNYYMQLVELRQQESLAVIMDKLERLPELSRQELKQLSDQIRNAKKPAQPAP